MEVQTGADGVVMKTALAAEKYGSATAVVSGGARFLGLSTDEWTVIAAIVGMAVAVAGYFTSLYFRHQHLKLARARLALDSALEE